MQASYKCLKSVLRIILCNTTRNQQKQILNNRKDVAGRKNSFWHQMTQFYDIPKAQL